MKSFVGIVCLYVVLLMGSCASTGESNVNSLDRPPDAKNMVILFVKQDVIECATYEALEKLSQVRSFSSTEYYQKGVSNFSELKEDSIISVWYKGPTARDPRLYLQKFVVTGKFDMNQTPTAIAKREKEKEIAEANRIEQAEKDAELQKPRFSPEGQEYIKRTLTQAVGETKNSANKGKTLFFESSVSLESSSITGTWRVSELTFGTPTSFTLMEYYEKPPLMLWGKTILYRVEISNIGIARFLIDSFRE